MASLVIMNGQRLDLTCRMKDADEVLKVFDNCKINFAKKYTSIHGNGGDSTITFVGIKSSEKRANISDALVELHALATESQIGNVYLQSWPPKKKNKGETTHKEHSIE